MRAMSNYSQFQLLFFLGIEVIAIATGKNPVTEHLEKVISSPGNLLNVTDYKDLYHVTGQVVLLGCQKGNLRNSYSEYDLKKVDVLS